MKKLNVKIDSETLEKFVFPFCNVDNQYIVNKFKNEGFTVREIVEPLMINLLKRKKTKAAVDLCKLINQKTRMQYE